MKEAAYRSSSVGEETSPVSPWSLFNSNEVNPKTFANISFTSSSTKYKQGTSSREINVENITPNPSVAAMGMRNCACTLFSINIGKSPKKVVSEVSRMGRNLATPA